MRFRTYVEPLEPMRGLEIPPEVRLPYSHQREHVRAIDSAKKAETRERRIEKALAMLRGPGVGNGR
jgi:hypothetical protein